MSVTYLYIFKLLYNIEMFVFFLVELTLKARRDIADYIKDGKIDRARIRVLFN